MRFKTTILIIFSTSSFLVALFIAYLVLIKQTDKYIEGQRNLTLVYDAHPLRRQVLRPNQTYTRSNQSITINAQGFRGSSVSTADADFRIFSIGGSSVFDHHLPDQQSWPEKIARQLKHKTKNIKSYNFGIPGYSSREALALYHDKLRYLKPNVVIVYVAWNDLKYMRPFADNINTDGFYRISNYENQYKFLTAPKPIRNFEALKLMLKSNTPTLRENKAPAAMAANQEILSTSKGLQYYQDNLAALVFEIQSSGAIPILVAENTLAFKDFPKDLLNKKLALQFVNLSLSELLDFYDQLAKAMQDIAKTQNAYYADFRSEISANFDFFVDHVHLSAKGSDKLSELLAKYLAQHFEDLYI